MIIIYLCLSFLGLVANATPEAHLRIHPAIVKFDENSSQIKIAQSRYYKTQSFTPDQLTPEGYVSLFCDSGDLVQSRGVQCGPRKLDAQGNPQYTHEGWTCKFGEGCDQVNAYLNIYVLCQDNQRRGH